MNVSLLHMDTHQSPGMGVQPVAGKRRIKMIKKEKINSEETETVNTGGKK